MYEPLKVFVLHVCDGYIFTDMQSEITQKQKNTERAQLGLQGGSTFSTFMLERLAQRSA